MRKIGKVARRCFLGAVEPITDHMKDYIPELADPNDCADLVRKVKADIENDAYQLFIPMYLS